MKKKEELTKKLDSIDKELDLLGKKMAQMKEGIESAYVKAISYGKIAAEKNASLSTCLQALMSGQMQSLVENPHNLYMIGALHTAVSISSYLVEKNKIDGVNDEEIDALAKIFQRSGMTIH